MLDTIFSFCYSFTNEFELIEVGDEVPESADFGVKLSGDSMEPRYINHQTVWVHQQEALLNGEIGIFYFNGNAFCKRLQDNKEGLFLISLNQKYAPIEVKENDSFKIFGKVVG
ncbi:MAG: S24 family peptidase [Lachnospiraceae bacterium]|nr:S24 family peptidase [Lachnospiraceae bacterium]